MRNTPKRQNAHYGLSLGSARLRRGFDVPQLDEEPVHDRDVRISNARMSGIACATVVLHVAPEAAAGGLLHLQESDAHIASGMPSGKRGRRCRPLKAVTLIFWWVAKARKC